MTTSYDSPLLYDGLYDYQFGTFDAGLLFTPPTLQTVPRVPFADRRHGPTSEQENPQGYRLMRHFVDGVKGVNVWHMSDGTWQMSDPVPGVAFVGTISEPYPDTDNTNGSGGAVNGAISSSWYPGGPGGVGSSGPGGDIQLVNPTIQVTYQGGHAYPVTSTEAAAITAVGLGAYLR